jgi:hypothetical protein
MILSLVSQITSGLACALLTADPVNLSAMRPPAPPYRPFLDPLDLHGWWWLMLLPMSFMIAVVYKAVRIKDLRGYWGAVLGMTGQIVIGMFVLGVATYLLVEVYVRWVAEHSPQ